MSMHSDKYWRLVKQMQNEQKHLICFHEDLKVGELLEWTSYIKAAKAGIKDCNKRVDRLRELMDVERKEKDDVLL